MRESSLVSLSQFRFAVGSEVTSSNASFPAWDQLPAAPWRPALEPLLPHCRQALLHGNRQTWRSALEALPQRTPSTIALNADTITVGATDDIDGTTREQLRSALQMLHPWRKGPFSFFGVHIDTEWRSDWKWSRVAPHIQSLAGRHVLDVGCGSGYHCWRMRGAGAASVLGVEPYALYCAQFLAAQHYIQDPAVHVVPLRCEDLPSAMHAFDTVFSMGVIYHRRSPLDHLSALRELLRPGGELVLESLVVEGDERSALLPTDRYARMRNVWFIPSPAMLEIWLQRSGFRDVRVVDVTVTSLEEQRSTPWMRFESLAQALAINDATQTVEGLPAPRRAVVIATAP